MCRFCPQREKWTITVPCFADGVHHSCFCTRTLRQLSLPASCCVQVCDLRGFWSGALGWKPSSFDSNQLPLLLLDPFRYHDSLSYLHRNPVTDIYLIKARETPSTDVRKQPEPRYPSHFNYCQSHETCRRLKMFLNVKPSIHIYKHNSMQLKSVLTIKTKHA